MKYKVSQIAEINSNSIKPKLYSGALNYEDTSSVILDLLDMTILLKHLVGQEEKQLSEIL